MAKMAVVGCEASGKTVFMAALTDYYRVGPDKMPCWLIPENVEAHRFSEMRRFEMRVKHEWPEATVAFKTQGLRWDMHSMSGRVDAVELLEFGGEVFRAAFREDESSPDYQAAVEKLVSFLIETDFIVVMVSLRELFRIDGDRSVFERDAESIWVTRGLLDFVTKRLPKGVGVVIALTQADRYQDELRAAGGAAGVLRSRWPMIASLYPSVPVVSVASVSKTTADGRPAEGYTTEGVLPVMKAFADHAFGSIDNMLDQLATMERALVEPASLSQDAIEDNLRQYEGLSRRFLDASNIVAEMYSLERSHVSNFLRESQHFWDGVREIDTGTLIPEQVTSGCAALERQCPAYGGKIRELKKMWEDKWQCRLREEADASARQEQARAEMELLKEKAHVVAAMEAIQKERSRRRMRLLFQIITVLTFLVMAVGAVAWCVIDKKERSEAESRKISEEKERHELELAKAKEAAAKSAAEVAEAEVQKRRHDVERLALQIQVEQQKKEKAKRQEEAVGILKNMRSALQTKEFDPRILEEAHAVKDYVPTAHVSEFNGLLDVLALMRRAELGQADAQAALAEKYYFGSTEKKDGVIIVKDIPTAFMWFERAAAGGDVRSNYYLGLMLMRVGTQGDAKKGFAHMYQAAVGGVPEAQLEVGKAYASGTGIAADQKEAVEWFIKSAAEGNARAQMELSNCLYYGAGIGKDLDRAYYWLTEAAKGGDGEACYEMGEQYRVGSGRVKQSAERALAYYRKAKAAKYGAKDLDERINEMVKKLGRRDD